MLTFQGREGHGQPGIVAHPLAQAGGHHAAGLQGARMRLGAQDRQGHGLEESLLPAIDATHDDALRVQDVDENRQATPQRPPHDGKYLQGQGIAFPGGQADGLGGNALQPGQVGTEDGWATLLEAEAYYVPVSPHDASGPINVVAGAQVMITVPNFYRVETPRFDLSTYNRFIQTPLDNRDGVLHLTDAPGLGIEMNLDFMRAHRINL